MFKNLIFVKFKNKKINFGITMNLIIINNIIGNLIIGIITIIIRLPRLAEGP